MENSMTDRNAKEDRQRRGLPKNIRQIGNVQGAVRIYMEDYVYTYLHGNGRSGWGHRGSIFVGTRWQENGQKYLFISGLVHIPDDCFKDGVPEFHDLMWAGIYQDIKRYYENVEILGWGMDVAGASARLTGSVEQLHRRAFHGQDRIAFFMDSLEKEEAFYVYEKNVLRRRDGYYVYYEKNPQMREYMLQGRTEEQPTEIDPQLAVVTSYRERAAKKGRSKGLRRVAYAACLTLLVMVSAMGVSLMTNAGRIHELEEAVAFLTSDKDDTDPALQNEQESAADGLQTESELNPPAVDTTAPDDAAADEPVQPDAAADEAEENEPDVAENEPETLPEEPDKTDEPEQQPQTAQSDEPAADADEPSEPAVSIPDTYIVQSGESLLGISQKLYGKNYTRELCERNGLEDENKIYAGQELLLLDK